MTPPWQRHARFGLPGAEMQVVFVVRDRLIQRGQLGIDKQMVMSRVRLVDASGGDAHLFESEPDREGGRHICAVVRRDDVDARARGRRMAGAWRRGLSCRGW